MIEIVRRDISESYGLPDKPNFEFEKEERRRGAYEPFLRDLAASLLMDTEGFFKIASVTDVNSDHGFTFIIRGIGEWWLQLSFVGMYAVLMRLTERATLEVIDPDAAKKSATEQLIVRLIANNGIHLLDKVTLETPIALKLFDTEPENVRVYQALFSDRDVLPWQRLGGVQAGGTP